MDNINTGLYNEAFYEQHKDTVKTFERIASLVMDIVNPESVVDFGCSIGAALTSFKSLGVKDVLGVDGFWVKDEQLLLDKNEFIRHDLSTGGLTLQKKYDLAMSTEVAEHILADKADDFVEMLVNASDVVLFGAAIPYQGGTNHVNEQWQEYWVEKFRKYGYIADESIRNQIWDNNTIEVWYKQNTLLYYKKEIQHTLRLPEENYPVYNVIHPIIYFNKQAQLLWQEKKYKELINALTDNVSIIPHNLITEIDNITGINLTNIKEKSAVISQALDYALPMIDKINELTSDSAIEIYQMLDMASEMSTDIIAHIDAGLRAQICAVQDEILERIADEMPPLPVKQKNIYTPCVQLRGNWQNVHIMKDCGLAGYTLGRETNMHSVMFFGSNQEEYGNLKLLPGLEMVYKDSSCDDTELYINYLEENHKMIDVLILIGLYEQYLPFLDKYRELRPDGKIYMALDMNSKWIENIPWDNPQVQKLGKQCDVIATSSRAVRDAMNADSKIPFSCRWLPNGFYNLSEIEIVADPNVKENIILTAGRIGTKQKNTGELLTAFAKVADKLPDWQLRLAGKVEPGFKPFIDDYFAKYPNLKEKVQVIGQITDKTQLYNEYAKAKIFALTSAMEAGTPNVYAEALHHGCMFITSGIDSADEIIDYGELGMKYPTGDVNALGNAMTEMCRNADKAAFDKHIPKALAYANRYYDWTRNAKKLAYMLFR